MNASSMRAAVLIRAVLVMSVTGLALGLGTFPTSRIEQVQAKVGVPNPYIDYIHLNGGSADSVTVIYGGTLKIEVQATNIGGVAGRRGGIYLSFPEFDSSSDVSLVDVVSLWTSSDDDDLRYVEHRPRDSQIWYECNSGYLDVTQELMVAGYAPSDWEPGEKIHMEVTLKLPAPGTYHVYAKAVVADAAGGDSYYADPASAAQTDQQCQPVHSRTVETKVASNALYLPMVLKDYEPSTPMRGVRMQASSCSTQSKCAQKLDCLQQAGANVLFYPIYYRDAYYHSDLMHHRSFDSLAYIVSEAHTRGMEVYALITAAYLGWPEHPQWNASLNHSGVPEDWLDFELPEARSFIADVAEEITVNYDVDGILLDYIRWHPHWRFDAEEHADTITATVRETYRRVKADREVTVAASVFKCRVHATDAGQMWYDWLDEGIVDYVTPMTYIEPSNVVAELEKYLDEWDESGHFPQRIIPRLSTCWFRPDFEQKTVDHLRREIRMCQEAGATGVALWDDRYICKSPNLVEALGGGEW